MDVEAAADCHDEGLEVEKEVAEAAAYIEAVGVAFEDAAVEVDA